MRERHRGNAAVVPELSCMELHLKERRQGLLEEGKGGWGTTGEEGRAVSELGGEEEEEEEGCEVELDSGLCVEGESEQSIGQMGLDSGERIEGQKEQEDHWLNMERQLECLPGRQGELELGLDSRLTGERVEESHMKELSDVYSWEKMKRGTKIDKRVEGERGESRIWMEGETEDRSMEEELKLCLRPVEEKRGMSVRISLEEVERYYRFSRCCYWLQSEY